MNYVSTITAGIKDRMISFLGSEYSELTNVTELEKNSFKGANQRYGVVADDANQVEGTTCNLTLNHIFELTLTDSYYSNSKASDLNKREKTIELQDLMINLYKDLIATKAGAPLLVMHTFNFNMLTPEYLEEANVVAIKANLTIKYRSLL